MKLGARQQQLKASSSSSSAESYSARTRYHRNTTSGRRGCLPFLCLIILLLCCFQMDSVAAGFSFGTGDFEIPKEDPYKVLGVKRNANQDTIKKAYRSKAKENHPDKNPDLDPDVANDNFRRIVDAFEVLSDPAKKSRYDKYNLHNSYRQRQRQQQQQQQQQQRAEQQRRQRNEEEQRRENRRRQEERRLHQERLQKARSVQDRVVRFSTLEELEESMMGEKKGRGKVFKKNLLLAFVGNKKTEQIVDDDLLFPYPFAGAGINGILWDDVLQTAKVRFNKASPLTQTFKVPANQKSIPHFVFCKKGNRAQNCRVFYHRSTSSADWSIFRHNLNAWIHDDMLVTDVRIVNHHSAPVRLFRYDANKKMHPMRTTPLPPGYSVVFRMNLGDRLRVIDGNTDQYPGSQGFSTDLLENLSEQQLAGAFLLDALITHDDGATVNIPFKQCYDLSLQCRIWVAQRGKRCDLQSEFMHNICGVSCGVCSESPMVLWNSIQYGLFHYPLHKLPNWMHPPVALLREVGHMGKFLWEDAHHVLSLRRNVAFCFFLAGVLVGCNLLFLRPLKQIARKSIRRRDLMLLYLSAIFVTYTFLFLSGKHAPFQQLKGLHADLRHVLIHRSKFYTDATYSVLAFGCVSWNLVATLLRWTFSTTEDRTFRIVQSLLMLTLVVLVTLFAAVLAMETNKERHFLWSHLLSMRKNAVAAILLAGLLLGATLRSSLRLTWCFVTNSTFQLLVFINAAVLTPIGCIVSKDEFFQRDLDHVLNYRLTAAAVFAVAGVLVGSMMLCWGRGYSFVESSDDDDDDDMPYEMRADYSSSNNNSTDDDEDDQPSHKPPSFPQ